MSVSLVFSSDPHGFIRVSTVISSILRRTFSPIVVKCYCRDFEPQSFETGQLKVIFVRTAQPVSGNFPFHVNQAVFDRLRILADEPVWNRAFVLDHDMIALCDVAPYFDEIFEGNLLMGRLFGPGNTLGRQMALRGGLPENLQHAAHYPYFYMGPMMNLKAMREEGTWEKLLEAHEALGQDEQMALTIATEGRVKGVGRKWNLVTQWDHLEEGPAGPERSMYGTVEEAADWKNGLPEGIIHWTGWEKPWPIFNIMIRKLLIIRQLRSLKIPSGTTFRSFC